MRKFAADIWKYVKPSGVGDAAMRFMPDLFFAGMSAMNAPEGTDPVKRVLIGLEDAGIGLGGSLALGGLSRYGAARAFKHLPEEQLLKRIDQGGMVGDLAAMPLIPYAPRPVLESSFNEAVERQRRQEDLTARQAEQERQELGEEYLQQDVQQRALAALLQSSGFFV